jgi:hypothetical protein
MGTVSSYRVRALRWYVAHQADLAALRRRRIGTEVEPPDPKQARIDEILRLRAEGKSQSDVAEMVGVSRHYVGKIEQRILPAIIAYLANADLFDAAADLLDSIIG